MSVIFRLHHANDDNNWWRGMGKELSRQDVRQYAAVRRHPWNEVTGAGPGSLNQPEVSGWTLGVFARVSEKWHFRLSLTTCRLRPGVKLGCISSS
jgi:hypothetical protein